MAQEWDTGLYDSKHAFVTQYGEALIELLDPKPGERVLDVGCGTGHLTKQIAASGAAVFGIDASENMIAAAQEAYPELDFRVANITQFVAEAPFDAVFSNAALHWVLNYEGAVRQMSAALEVGGRFVIEMGGHGNVAALIGGLFEALKELDCHEMVVNWYFPTIGEYASLLEKYNLEPALAWLFDRPTALEGEDGLVNWYRQFRNGIQADVCEEDYEEAARRAQDFLRGDLFRGGVWYADYRRLRVMARRI